MRSKLIFSLTLLLSFAIFSCKKKKKEEEPAASPAPVTPAHMNSMTAKLNGTAWAMGSENGLAYTATSRSGMQFGFVGQTAISLPYTYIALNFYPSTGTYTLSKYGLYQGKYNDSNHSFTSTTGTINISQLDTSSTYGLPKIFKATFSFLTDTFGGQSYNVTEGVVDYKVN